MNHEELTRERLQAAIDASINTFEKKKENAFKVLSSICDEKTQVVFKEELENLFDMLGELPLEIELYQEDKRFINFINDQKVVGTLAMLDNSLEYYFDVCNQYVSFKLEKYLDVNGQTKYYKKIYVDGKDKGKNSSRRDERDLPEITKMIFAIEEIIDEENRVVEQNFILKESSQDINSFNDEDDAEYSDELHITRYNSIVGENDEIRVYSDCPRGFSNAKKVCEWAKLPKAKVEYREDYLPFSLLSNLEFISKRMLCSDEFKGFKITPVIEDCDDKYIFLAKVDDEYYGKVDDEELGEGLE